MTSEPGLPEDRRAESRRTITTRLRRVPRKSAITLLVIVAVLVGARVSAPFAIEWYVNRKLATLPDYRGRVGDVDLSLLAGKFAVEDVRVDIRADKGDGDGDRG